MAPIVPMLSNLKPCIFPGKYARHLNSVLSGSSHLQKTPCFPDPNRSKSASHPQKSFHVCTTHVPTPPFPLFAPVRVADSRPLHSPPLPLPRVHPWDRPAGVFAEVEPSSVGVGQHFVGRAVAQHLAGADHVAAVGNRQCLALAVIGHQDRDAIRRPSRRMIRWMLLIVTGSMPVNGSSSRMICGFGDQAAGDFQPPLFATRDHHGHRLADVDDVELLAATPRSGAAARGRSMPSISMTASRFCSTVSLRKTLCS